MLGIRKNDLVIVITGKNRGKSGRIKKVVDRTFVVVEGVNLVKRHRKASQNSPGGIEQKEAPLHISNVMLMDTKTKEPSRFSMKMIGGKKMRVSVKSGEIVE